ncbi:MAG TPA: DUF167 domain-containing protein [Chloroflexota bacterium]|nr:DUF167 domain-containing protein [Chloroflexota bacterium]
MFRLIVCEALALVRFVVHVHPRSTRIAVRRGDGRVEVWTTSPPVQGKANESVREILADWLDIPVSRVRILSGGTGRTKLVDAMGVHELPS